MCRLKKIEWFLTIPSFRPFRHFFQPTMCSTKQCPICVSNVKASRMMTCPSCHEEICFGCVSKYLLTINEGEDKCMSCQNTLDRAFIIRSLPPSLVFTTLKKHREDFLYEKEKAMLPATMPLLQLEDDHKLLSVEKANVFLEMKPLKFQKEKLEIEIRQATRNKQDTTHLKEERKTVSQALKEIKHKLYDVNKRLDANYVQQLFIRNPNASVKQSEAAVLNIMCPCPCGSCRGYVVANDTGRGGSCGVCHADVCGKCYCLTNTTNGEPHECNKDDIESVKLIKKECKACPQCGVLSRKTEGCSQVWCMMCKTAWDWNTQRVDRGWVHATDYYNYLRTNNITIAPVCDDGNPAYMLLHLHSTGICTAKEADNVSTFCRRVAAYREHLNDVIQPPDNTDIRLRYLRNEIDEVGFKRVLYKRDKEYIFKQEVHKIHAAWTQVMQDLTRVACLSSTKAAFKRAYANVEKVHDMMMDEYQELAKAFKSVKQCPFHVHLYIE